MSTVKAMHINASCFCVFYAFTPFSIMQVNADIFDVKGGQELVCDISTRCLQQWKMAITANPNSSEIVDCLKGASYEQQIFD